MGYFTDTVRALATTARNFFRPATTVQFPKVIRPRAERYRASFALLHDEQGDEACIGCLQCERICPSKVISIKGPVKKDSPITGKKRGYADDFTLDLSACIFCELCVQVCPADAIVMTREQEQPAFAREDLVLTMAKLYANEKSKTRAWGDGTKLMQMQAMPKPAAPPKVEPPVAAKAEPARPELGKPEASPAHPESSRGTAPDARPEPAKAEAARPEPGKPEAPPAHPESSRGTAPDATPDAPKPAPAGAITP